MKAQELKRLEELELENTWLERMVADQALDIEMLEELNRGNWGARSGGVERCPA